MKIFLYLIILTIPVSIISCKKKDNSINCTEEFRTVTITVNGDKLDNYYTIRESNGDTIKLNAGNIWGENIYPVLNDSYQSIIANKTENFQFKGIIHDTLVVNEKFVIKADDCHIDYLSGKLLVNI